MIQMSIPKLDEDILASSLKRQYIQLQEIIEAIERRDISLDEVRNSLGTLSTNLSQIRKRVPPKMGLAV